MFVIENGFTYIAFLMFLCGGLLALQKYAKWKIFNVVPPLVWIYLIGMVCCTAGMFNSDGVNAAYGVLKNNVRHDLRHAATVRLQKDRQAGRTAHRHLPGLLGHPGCGLHHLLPHPQGRHGRR